MTFRKDISPNLGAFLDMLSVSEGTSISKATLNDGYDVIVKGVDGKDEIFIDYSAHPFHDGRKSKQINSKGLTSNASGRYQFMLRDYAHYRDLLRLNDKSRYPDGAFSPKAQDSWAIQLIKERRVLDLIEQGKFVEAVAAVRNLWASLPGAGYNQPEHSIEKLLNVYLNYGGKLWESKQSSAQSLPQLSPSLQPGNLGAVKENQTPTLQTESAKQTSLLQGILSLLQKLIKPN